MPPLNIMIKPSSSICNLKCQYCFYHDEAQLRTVPSFGFMLPSTLEEIVKKSLSYAEHTCTFAFQGGEPTLVGLSFYQKLLQLEKKYNTQNINIQNIIQTNGYIIDKTWTSFFKKHNFYVGLSIDGPQRIHDLFRHTRNGHGTFLRLQETIQLFQEIDIDFNILTVVTAELARHPEEVYSFYKSKHLLFQQYIPCLNPLGQHSAKHSYTLTPELYGHFLVTLFHLWLNDYLKGKIISITFFENLIGILKNEQPTSCTMFRECQKQYVVEADGSVYPCDFYALDNYYIGNLTKDSFLEIDKKRASIRFIEQSQTHPITCLQCKWHFLCNAGCRRERDTGTGRLSTNFFCSSYKYFFEQTFQELLWLSKQ